METFEGHAALDSVATKWFLRPPAPGGDNFFDGFLNTQGETTFFDGFIAQGETTF